MPEPGLAGLAWLGRAFGPLAQFLLRGRKLADGEIADLKAQLITILEKATASSVEAQTAIRGSPNEESARDAAMAAIRLSTEVGQDLACLFDLHSIVPQNARLQSARIRYRELISDEFNLDITEPAQRLLRCADVESATAELHAAVRDVAFAKWGIGVGSKAGRLNGRRLPR